MKESTSQPIGLHPCPVIKALCMSSKGKNHFSRNHLRSHFIALLLFIVFDGSLLAQQSLVPPTDLLFTDFTTYRVGTEYKSLSIGDKTYSQAAFPISIVTPIMQSLVLRVSNIPFTASTDSISGVNGIGDTQLGLSFFLPGEHLLFIADVNLPTVLKPPSREKQTLSSVVGFNALGYQVQSFGQGFDFQLGGAGAIELSPRMIMTVGAGYLNRGEYQPIDTLGQYNPGDEFTFDVGSDFHFSRRQNVSVDAAITFYGEDKLTSVDTRGNSIGDPFVIRKVRTRLILNARYGLVTPGDAEHIVFLKTRFRPGSDDVTIANATLSNGPQLELKYTGSIPFGEESLWRFKMYFHAAYFASSELNPQAGLKVLFHDALLATPGIGISFTPGANFPVETGLRYTVGSARTGQTKETVKGLTFNILGSIAL